MGIKTIGYAFEKNQISTSYKCKNKIYMYCIKYIRNRLLKYLKQAQDGVAHNKSHASKTKLNYVSMPGSPRKRRPSLTNHCSPAQHKVPNLVPLLQPANAHEHPGSCSLWSINLLSCAALQSSFLSASLYAAHSGVTE